MGAMTYSTLLGGLHHPSPLAAHTGQQHQHKILLLVVGRCPPSVGPPHLKYMGHQSITIRHQPLLSVVHWTAPLCRCGQSITIKHQPPALPDWHSLPSVNETMCMAMILRCIIYNACSFIPSIPFFMYRDDIESS